DRALSIVAIRNHPLLAEGDVFEAFRSGEVTTEPESPIGVHIRGGASDQTAYLLDGVPVFSPYHSAGVFAAWNPDALAGLELTAAAPPPSRPHALSGTIAAFTREPGRRFHALASLSTTQARATFDGPLGGRGAGYLVSLRRDHPAFFAPREPTYLGGSNGDGLAKVEAPALGGRLRLLGYDSTNRIDAAAVADVDSAPGSDGPRNEFAWNSHSFGAAWSGTRRDLTLRLEGWRATSDAEAVWAGESTAVDLDAARRDHGVLAEIGKASLDGRSASAGFRFDWSTTSYRVTSDSAGGPALDLDARTPVATAFARHARPLGARVRLDLGIALALAGGVLRAAPRGSLEWRASDRLTLSGHATRSHQFAQSLRNAESVVGHVFPADLYAGAGTPGVPVAHGDQAVLAADCRPFAGVRLGAQAYTRRLGGLLLVAPRDGEPFSTGAFVAGEGQARGVSIEAVLRTARLALVSSYGMQRVRLSYRDSSYVPDHGATHLFEGGVILFPGATSSLRIGVTGSSGRRTTSVPGGFEWEACNLVDQGCEFGGSPHYGSEPLGATTLPLYLRVDVGVRKHWHVGIAGRDASIALFGTATNVLGRSNLRTYARDPENGRQVGIEMRP
ncbi:MAG: hypothetical protein ABIP29_07950, partial [Candidatus Eisenbacteria bacterium]